MKKALSILMIAAFALLSISCDRNEQIFNENLQTTQQIELSKLMNSIDSLNNYYLAIGTTRAFTLSKWQRRFVCSFVDACVGTVTIETGPVGAFVFSTLASGLYEDYLDVVLGSTSEYSLYSPNGIRGQQATIIFPTKNASFVDSIGYYHNLVLDKIKSKNKSYIDDGKIQYQSYFKEIISESKRLGIPVSKVEESTYIYKYIDLFIKNLAKETEISRETLLSIVFNNAFVEFGYSDIQSSQIYNICNKIIYDDLCVNDDQLESYGIQINNLIENSEVDSDLKIVMKIANNIAINSSIFWKTR